MTLRVVLDEGSNDLSPEKILAELEITNDPSRVGFVGAGQAGFKIIELITDMLDPHEYSSTRLLAANTDTKPFVSLIKSEGAKRPKHLDAWLGTIREGRFDLVQLGVRGTGAGGDTEFSAVAFEEKVSRIEKLTKDLNAVFIFGGEGGGTGTGVLPKAAALFKDKPEVAAFAIPIMPFTFEGDKRYKRATEGREAVAGQIAIITIYNQVIYAREKNKSENINAEIETVNRRIVLPLIETLTQLTLKTASTINRDLSDLRRVAQGREAYVASVAIGKEEQVKSAVQRLLHDDAQDIGIVRRSGEAIVIFQGPFSREDVGTATDIIRETMKKENPDQEISLTPGFDQGGEERKLYFICSSQNLGGPKVEWATVEEKKQTEMRNAEELREIQTCENLTLEDLKGPYHKSIEVPQQGGKERLEVSENFFRFWNYSLAKSQPVGTALRNHNPCAGIRHHVGQRSQEGCHHIVHVQILRERKRGLTQSFFLCPR